MREELTLEEYKIRENDFFKRHSEYLVKKIAINKEEHQFIENIKDGETFSDKSDIYFENKEYKPVVKKFQKKRQNLNYRYKGFTSQYIADFFTELTDEAITFLNLDKDNAPQILEEVKHYRGQKCHPCYDTELTYTLARAIISPDDYYYDLVDEKGNHFWFTCVGSLEWIENKENGK